MAITTHAACGASGCFVQGLDGSNASTGEIVVSRSFAPVPHLPKVAQLVTEPDQKLMIGENWHKAMNDYRSHAREMRPITMERIALEGVPITQPANA